jgi:Tfp pilus assembly PilM family ATPase
MNGAAIAVFHREFPKMPAEALEKTCRFELKKEVKYPVDEAILVVRVLKELEGRGEDGKAQKRVRVMFAAMNAAECRRLEAVCKEAGLVLAGVVSPSLSLAPLARRLRLLDGLGPEEVILVLDFGNSQMTADFISDSSLRFSKSIGMERIGLTEVVRALGREPSRSRPRAQFPSA